MADSYDVLALELGSVSKGLTTESPVEDFDRFEVVIKNRCKEMSLNFDDFSNLKEAEMAVRAKQIAITTQSF